MIYVITDGNFFLPTLGSGVPWGFSCQRADKETLLYGSCPTACDLCYCAYITTPALQVAAPAQPPRNLCRAMCLALSFSFWQKKNFFSLFFFFGQEGRGGVAR